MKEGIGGKRQQFLRLSRHSFKGTEESSVPVLSASMSQAEKEWVLQRLHRAVAATFRHFRFQADMSQDQVAYRLKWGRDYYVVREQGRRATTLPEFLVIAHALKCAPGPLLDSVLLEYSTQSFEEQRSQMPSVPRRPDGARPRGFIPTTGSIRRHEIPAGKNWTLPRFEIALATTMHACRTAAGLSRHRVGALAGVHRGYIKRFEQVGVRLPIGLFIVVAPALGFSAKELMQKVIHA